MSHPFISALSALFVFLLLPCHSFAQEPINIVVGGDYPPYHSESLPGYGLNTQIVTAAFKAKNVDVSYRHLDSWQQAFDDAKQGNADATALWEFNPAYLRDFYVSDTVYKINAHFYHKKTLKFNWDNVADLQGLTISALFGGFYGDDFEEAERKGEITVIRTHDEKENVMKLLDDQVDIAPLYIAYVNYVLKSEGLESELGNLTYHPKPLFINSLHLLLPRARDDSLETMETFNQGLKLIKADGTLQAILNAHLNYR
ncbi:transporter substrate-binding domain-containing protein [Vibrio ostreicida]|uniref:Transporter substrate-binding domain-containing protein n=1 Tax=Vibrio ostreicida TaxID=526588 RepID=A0ABT8BX42_9VIBR|nr:transporter substrate-binding domain-containing protein [Vibrio ostreicida]MDN3611568.1 transporter substrate-binding domain-containing protein [Vibrio ostreicida]NPD09060.1 transporter substrate-binding domain-containing protein [Vibrio ostreicida]